MPSLHKLLVALAVMMVLTAGAADDHPTAQGDPPDHEKVVEDRDENNTEELLKLAKRHHFQKNYDLARKSLVAVLEGDDKGESFKRDALLELASVEQHDNQLAKAQQILAQYAARFPDDPIIPEITLRQGLLYRQMGASGMAIAKFYSVMTSALGARSGAVEDIQRLVLLAQNEIANTYYAEAKYNEASELFGRLLKQEIPNLNRADIHLKLFRCVAAQNKTDRVILNAADYLANYPTSPYAAEVRFGYARALQDQGQTQAALRQVKELLSSPTPARETNWSYWQARAGNEIANQLYKEGDFLNALEVYKALTVVSSSASWQMPVHYQMGLIYERLEQPEKAAESYAKITQHKSQEISAGLKTVIEMAQWRTDFLNWQNKRQSKIENQTTEQ